ncbi:hypothetical protein [Promicromonospora sp. NPDC023805]|uniref:hypothetical protein n=1 Tax=Promicromonospora sp. NPDC023805 TaxID=3154696 RepID=UPI0033CB88E3
MAPTSSRRVAIAEGVIGGIAGAVIEVANLAFFANSSAGLALGVGALIGGLLLSVQRSAIERMVESELAPLRKVESYVDISSTASYEPFASIVQRYASITEVEFESVKSKIVAEAHDRMRALAIDKRSPTLQTGDYYEWLFRQFGQTQRGEYVHAVSMSSEEEWNDSDLETNFLEANVKAAERGVDVTRIFIVPTSRIAEFVRIPPIVAHTDESEVPLRGLWVRLEHVERYDPNLLRSLGEGFLDFNGRVGLEDRFDPFGEARGDVTMLPADLRRMRKQFEQLQKMAKPLTQNPS